MSEALPITSCEASLNDIVSDAVLDARKIADYMRLQGIPEEVIERTHVSIDDRNAGVRRSNYDRAASPVLEQEDSKLHISLNVGSSVNSWLTFKHEEYGSEVTPEDYDDLDLTATDIFSHALKRELNELGNGADRPKLSHETVRYLGLTAVYLQDTDEAVISDEHETEHPERETDTTGNLVSIKVNRSYLDTFSV